MPEQKMSYQGRLLINKKKVAKSAFNTVWEYALDEGSKTEESVIRVAKDNIAAQAEAIRWALWKFYEDGEMRDDVDENMLYYLINEHLNEYGYIEPKTEEDGK